MKQNGKIETKQNKIKCHRSNSTFGNSNTRADASVAKRAISADAHSRINWTKNRIDRKENRIDYFEKRSKILK